MSDDGKVEVVMNQTEQQQVPTIEQPEPIHPTSSAGKEDGQVGLGGEVRSVSPAVDVGTNPVVSFEVRPRDFYIYYVTLENAGDLVRWSFYTKKKNIAFGLYYLHSPRQPQQQQEGEDVAAFNSRVHEVIEGSRAVASIWPPSKNAAERMGGGGGVGLSRSNSQLSRPLGASDGSLAIPSSSLLTTTGNNVDGGGHQHHANTSNNSLASSMNLESSFHANQEDFFTATAAFPLGQVSTEQGQQHQFEFLEILEPEKYESYETTINGTYKAPLAGVYALCFDNTFSINTSKQVYLSLKIVPAALLADHGAAAAAVDQVLAGSLGIQDDHVLHAGWMMKKRRKSIQGWAKRWVQLERNGVLSYYANRNGTCRGSIDVRRSTVSRVPHRRLLTIDSSEATFHLRALDDEDFEAWTGAFNAFVPGPVASPTMAGQPIPLSEAEEAQLNQAEAVIGAKMNQANAAIASLRDLAASTDDGSLARYITPLEAAFGQLDELFKELNYFAGQLQALRKTQPAKVTPAKEEEEVFYDLEICDISSEDEDEEWADAFEDEGQLVTSTSRMSLEAIALPSSDVNRIEFQYRNCLPAPAPPITINMASFMMKSIGKDFSSMIMPMIFNEPLGALQKLCEEMEYAELLDRAAAESDPLERLVHIVGFAVSGYANNQHRAERKPFNPILGETYEYQDGSRQLRFVAEKVSHKPLVMACHATGAAWEFWQDLKLKPKFWGKSIESVPSGTLNVRFANGDHFQWSKVVSCLRNAYGGNKRIENYGDVTITNLRTGDVASLTFKSSGGGFFGGGSSQPSNEVQGFVRSSDGSRKIRVSGRWDDLMMREHTDGQLLVIWKANALPPLSHDYYGFSGFTLRLNQLLPGHASALPRTDTRLRPDQRLLEEARVPEAEAEQLRLIERSRQVRARMEEEGLEWQPRWFRHVDGRWHFTGQYWAAREAQQWTEVPELW